MRLKAIAIVCIVGTALVLTAFTTGASEPKAEHPPHVQRMVSDPSIDPVIFDAVGMADQTLSTAYTWVHAYNEHSRQQWFAGVAAAEAARTGSARSGGGGRCGSDFACFRECTLAIESHGNYGAVSSNGTYRGAWQFDQGTWNSNAAAAGRGDLVGADPASVDPASQDQVAQQTYNARGNQPWGGRC
jgi:hypothetical protein